MNKWVIDRRDRIAQRLTSDSALIADSPRFVVITADTLAEAWKKAGVGPSD